MGTLNDEILRVTGGPTVNDGLRSFFDASVDESLNDAEFSWLKTQARVTTASTINDAWMQFLSDIPGTLNDRLLAYWSARSSVPPSNLAINSFWAGASGSVGGADFVGPTGWTLGFWPPTDAIVIANGAGDQIQFQVTADRGYVSLNIDGTGLVGEVVNFSCFIDASVLQSGARVLHMAGDITEILRVPSLPNDFVGRVSALYQITGLAPSIRIGAGTTSNSSQDFTASRPQITEGETLWPYQST